MGTLTAELTTLFDDAGDPDPATDAASMADAFEAADTTVKKFGANGTAPVAKQSIDGSSDSDKITSLIAALVAIGFATDDTT